MEKGRAGEMQWLEKVRDRRRKGAGEGKGPCGRANACVDAMSLSDYPLRFASEVVLAAEGGLAAELVLAHFLSRRLNPVPDRMTLNGL